MYDPSSHRSHLVLSGHDYAGPRQGFTLIELLLVMCIVFILIGMLLPGIAMVMRTAQVVNCANNQRQLAMGFLAYGADYRELPTTYSLAERIDPYQHLASSQVIDEGSGSIDIGKNGTSPFQLAWEGDFVTSAIKGCQLRDIPPYGDSWLPGYTGNDYHYNGPGAFAPYLANNGQMSGLYSLGGYASRGETHGVSLRHQNPSGLPNTGMFSCRTILSADKQKIGEPHSGVHWTDIDDMGSYGNAQYDWEVNNSVWKNSPYNRNVTYGDGHVKHLVTTRGQLSSL